MSNKPRKKIAVVHSRPDAIIDILKQYDCDGMACSMLDISPFVVDIPDADIYIATSVNAVPFVPHHKKLFVVGEETYLAAQAARLDVQTPFAMNAAELPHIVKSDGRIVHLRGKDVSPDSEKAVNELNASSVMVYEARTAPLFPQDVLHAVETGELSAVLMFSARAAEAFTALAKRATNMDAWKRVTGVAISQRVAGSMSGLPFASIRVAAYPNRKDILEALTHEHID